MAITQHTLRLTAEQRAELTRTTDGHATALVGVWVNAWDDVADDLDAALLSILAGAKGEHVSRAAMLKSTRLTAAIETIAGKLHALAEGVETIVGNDLPGMLNEAVRSQVGIIQSQLPDNQTRVTAVAGSATPDALDTIANRTLEQIHKASYELAPNAVEALKRELVKGVVVGDNPRLTAQLMVGRAEQRFNGGLTRAMGLARTEVLDAHRAATKATEDANKGILDEWEWHADLGPRTCPSCLAMHGTRHPLDESGPNDHQQGRCARISVTKTWKELGFNIEEPASATPSSEGWFNNLTADTQKSIMGPERLRLLQSGEITWRDLSRVQHNEGWRDSHVVVPVKDLLESAA